jgi:diguanylate cyclase
MELSRPMPLGQASAAAPAAQLAKAALRRFALSKLEPTPENYARAYDEELGIAQRPVMPARALTLLQRMAAGLLRDEAARESFAQSFMRACWQQVEQLLDDAATDESTRAEGLAQLLENLVAALDRGSRQWTRARRKEGVQRVLAGSKADAQRLQQRLSHLVASWDSDSGEAASANDLALDPPELAAGEARDLASPTPVAGMGTCAAPDAALPVGQAPSPRSAAPLLARCRRRSREPSHWDRPSTRQSFVCAAKARCPH